MATRCTIKIIGDNENQYFYHHWDGYPKGVGYDIFNYLNIKDKWDFSEIVKEMNSGYVGDDPTYEPSEGIHGDENYIYVINCNKKEFICYKNNKLTWNECEIFIDENIVII